MANKILVFLVIVLGLVFISAAASTEDNKWKEVTGTVITSKLIEKTDSGDSSSMYQPYVKYSYEYEGETYSGKCCSISSSGYASMQKFVDEHPVGASVNVLVNKDNPEDSKLKDEPTLEEVMKGACAPSFMLLALLGALVIYRR